MKEMGKRMNKKVNPKFFEILDQISEEHEEHSKLNLNSNVLIVDGMNTFIRSWCVNPSLGLHGEHIGGIVGFLKSIGHAIRILSPTRCIIVFDGRGGSKKRRKIYKDYKKGNKSPKRVNRAYGERESVEDDRLSMKKQIIKLLEYLNHFPVSVMSFDDIEADDVIAYISKQVLNEPNQNIRIMSADKDFLQLVNDRIHVWSPTKKVLYTPEKVFEEFEIPPENFIVYKMIEGDNSDNIPGIKGIGRKTLIKRFPKIEEEKIDLDYLVEHADEVDSDLKVYNKILDNQDVLERNYKLMQLEEVDIPSMTGMKIVERLNDDIPELDGFGFRKNALIEGGLGDAFPYVGSWLRNFTFLNGFVRKQNDNDGE